MSCDETLALLAYLPLDALEGVEIGTVDGHLHECGACRARADALRDAYALLADPELEACQPEVPPGAWSAIVAALDAATDGDEGCASPASALPIAVVCTFCHGSLIKADAAYCASCLAPHHADCFAAHGRCSVHGCEETATVRPKLEVHVSRRGWRSWRRDLRRGLLGVALAGSVAAFAYDRQELLVDRVRALPLNNRRALSTLGTGEDDRERLEGATRSTTAGAFLGALVKRPQGGVAGAEIVEAFRDGPVDQSLLSAGDTITWIDDGRGRVAIESPQALERHLRGTFRPFSVVTIGTYQGLAARVRLSAAGPPGASLRGSPSGDAWAPAKILGLGEYGSDGVLLATHARDEHIFETYPAARMPDGELLGTLHLRAGTLLPGERTRVHWATLARAKGEGGDPLLKIGETIWLQQYDRDASPDANTSWTIDLSKASRLYVAPPAPVYLGLELQDRDDASTGLSVTAVLPGGPADRAGLQAGDVLTGVRSGARSAALSFDGRSRLTSFMGGCVPGELVRVAFVRAGRRRLCSATLDDPARSHLFETEITLDTQPPRIVATIRLVDWSTDTLEFDPSASTYNLLEKTFAVSLPGGGEFARVRVEGQAGALRTAAHLRGPSELLDLPSGAVLVLTQVHPDEPPSALDTRVSQQFLGSPLRLPATYLGGCAGLSVVVGRDLDDVVVTADWRQKTVLQCLVDLAAKAEVRIEIKEDVIHFAKE